MSASKVLSRNLVEVNFTTPRMMNEIQKPSQECKKRKWYDIFQDIFYFNQSNILLLM